MKRNKLDEKKKLDELPKKQRNELPKKQRNKLQKKRGRKVIPNFISTKEEAASSWVFID